MTVGSGGCSGGGIGKISIESGLLGITSFSIPVTYVSYVGNITNFAVTSGVYGLIIKENNIKKAIYGMNAVGSSYKTADKYVTSTSKTQLIANDLNPGDTYHVTIYSSHNDSGSDGCFLVDTFDGTVNNLGKLYITIPANTTINMITGRSATNTVIQSGINIIPY